MRTKTKAYLFLLASAALLIYYMAFIRKPDTGAKKVTVEIMHPDGSCRTVEASTHADNLRELLDARNLVSGRETEYGLMLITVDGVSVNRGEAWIVARKGVILSSSIDTIPLADGDFFTFSIG